MVNFLTGFFLRRGGSCERWAAGWLQLLLLPLRQPHLAEDFLVLRAHEGAAGSALLGQPGEAAQPAQGHQGYQQGNLEK